MDKTHKLENIELRSESVQEILGRPPRWIIRWGISIIFIVITGLIIGSYFFKYPDVITATITVTTENLPAGLMAKTTGRIDSIFVSEKQLVKKGEIIALIENPARFEDVMSIKNYELRTAATLVASSAKLITTNYPALRAPLQTLKGIFFLPSAFCLLLISNLANFNPPMKRL